MITMTANGSINRGSQPIKVSHEISYKTSHRKFSCVSTDESETLSGKLKHDI